MFDDNIMAHHQISPYEGCDLSVWRQQSESLLHDRLHCLHECGWWTESRSWGRVRGGLELKARYRRRQQWNWGEYRCTSIAREWWDWNWTEIENSQFGKWDIRRYLFKIYNSEMGLGPLMRSVCRVVLSLRATARALLPPTAMSLSDSRDERDGTRNESRMTIQEMQNRIRNTTWERSTRRAQTFAK